ncbi:MAG: mandelate racemase/muconate lactonizing enzyme family protein [Phycisphaerae bacterium]
MPVPRKIAVKCDLALARGFYHNARMAGFVIKSARVLHLRVPVDNPVRTSFGVMDSRHAVLLVLEDGDGRRGVGESWVNFPAWAADERTAAFRTAYIPYLTGKSVEDIPAFIAGMARAFRGTAQQSGTIGPWMQAMCAVELALWDLAARIEGKPLCKLLFDKPATSVPVYGSGINHPIPFNLIDDLLARGVRLFKLKLGFGREIDMDNLARLRAHLDGRAAIAVDINRGWTLQEAYQWQDILEDHDVQWLEEPLRADEEEVLGALRARKKVPLAAGENVIFDPVVKARSPLAHLPLDILQPDITKNCCLHTCLMLLPVARRHRMKVYPHFLGSAPGQAASLHLAAGCGETVLEWDINPNPLRTDLFTRPMEIRDGRIEIPPGAGLGWELDDKAIEQFGVGLVASP